MIGKLYDVEAAINGKPLAVRHDARQKQSRPRVEEFRCWCERDHPDPRQGRSGPGHTLRAQPLDQLYRSGAYAAPPAPRSPSLLDDSRVAIDNNAAERAIKPIALGRKNFLFAGSDAGGEVLANAMTVIETAKLSGLNPEAYLADILGRIRTHDPKRLEDLLPWQWKANRNADQKAA